MSSLFKEFRQRQNLKVIRKDRKGNADDTNAAVTCLGIHFHSSHGGKTRARSTARGLKPRASSKLMQMAPTMTQGTFMIPAVCGQT